MAAKIKLQRVGSKNRPSYRVVVQDRSAPTRGRVVAILGQYDTLQEPTRFEVDREKTLDWIKKGAKPTEKVRILLGKAGILPPVDLSALKKKKPKSEAEAPPPAAEVKSEAAPAAAEPVAAEQTGGAEK